jgi:hypothetical protein
MSIFKNKKQGYVPLFVKSYDLDKVIRTLDKPWVQGAMELRSSMMVFRQSDLGRSDFFLQEEEKEILRQCKMTFSKQGSLQ